MTLAEATAILDAPDHDRRSVWSVVSSIGSTLLTIVVSVVATLAVVVAVASHLSPNTEYGVLGHPVLSMLSGSMSPTIHTGDLIIDDAVSADQAARLHVGQIITFHRAAGDARTETHRIVDVHNAEDGSVLYTTKGDANNAPDAEPLPSSRVIGVFHSKISRGGYILNALHRPTVLWLLLASPTLWFISDRLRRMAVASEEDDGEP